MCLFVQPAETISYCREGWQVQESCTSLKASPTMHHKHVHTTAFSNPPTSSSLRNIACLGLLLWKCSPFILQCFFSIFEYVHCLVSILLGFHGRFCNDFQVIVVSKFSAARVNFLPSKRTVKQQKAMQAIGKSLWAETETVLPQTASYTPGGESRCAPAEVRTAERVPLNVLKVSVLCSRSCLIIV